MPLKHVNDPWLEFAVSCLQTCNKTALEVQRQTQKLMLKSRVQKDADEHHRLIV